MYENYDYLTYTDPIFLNMYVVAVQSGRFTIDYVPEPYNEKVVKILKLYEK